MQWLRLAAYQGHPNAQANLGVMYNKGEGVLADHISAHMWFNISGANGNEKARSSRKKVEQTMTPADISEAVSAARTCMSSGYQNCR